MLSAVSNPISVRTKGDCMLMYKPAKRQLSVSQNNQVL
jgi:hypothetical protein